MTPQTGAPDAGGTDVLVGSSNAAIVNGIEEMVARRDPSLVCVFGLPGAGKTRVVRELYRRLAANQEFWPPDLDVGDGRMPLDARRKSIAPPNIAGVGEPEFLWVGLRLAANRDPVTQVLEVLGQLTGQLLRYVEAFSKPPGRLQTAWQRLRPLAEPAIGLSPAGFALDAGTLMAEGMLLAAEVGGKLGERDIRESSMVETYVASTSSREVESLREIAATVPVVIAVEDAHLAQDNVLQLFELLMARDEAPGRADRSLHVLLTATTPSRPFVSSAPFFEWLSDSRIEAELDQRRHDFTVQPLTRADALVLAGQLFGAAPSEKMALLVEQSGGDAANPLLLSLHRELLSRPGDFVDGHLASPSKRIQTLPKRLADIDERKLREAALSPDVRGRLELILAWLAVAMVPVPTGLLNALLGRESNLDLDVLRYELGWVHLLGDGTVSIGETWHEEFARRLAEDLDPSRLLDVTIGRLTELLEELRWPATQVVIRTAAEGLVLQYLNVALAVVGDEASLDVAQLRRLRAMALAGLGAVDVALDVLDSALDMCDHLGERQSREGVLALLLQANLCQRLWYEDRSKRVGLQLVEAATDLPESCIDLAPDCVRWAWPEVLAANRALVLRAISSLRARGPQGYRASFTLRARLAVGEGATELVKCYRDLSEGFASRDPQLNTEMLAELAQAWFAMEDWRRATDLALAALDSAGFTYLSGDDSEHVCRLLVKAGSRCGDKNAVFRGGNGLLRYAQHLHSSLPVGQPVEEARLLNLIHPVLNAALCDRELTHEFLERSADLLEAVLAHAPDSKSIWAIWQRDVVLLNAARCFALIGDEERAAEFVEGVGCSGVRPPGLPYGMMEFRHAAEASLILARGGRTQAARFATERAQALIDEALALTGWETVESNGDTIGMLMQAMETLGDDSGLCVTREALLTWARDRCDDGYPDAGALVLASVVTPLGKAGCISLTTPIMEAVACDPILKAASESMMSRGTGQTVTLRPPETLEAESRGKFAVRVAATGASRGLAYRRDLATAMGKSTTRN